MSAEEIRRLEEAVSSDEADDFETLLQACSQSSRPFNIDDLVPLMFTAIRKDDTAVVETLVSRGMKISHPLIKAATSAKAKNCMTLFTKYGWDINAPISRTEPPAFVYGFSSYPVLQNLPRGSAHRSAAGTGFVTTTWRFG